MDILDHAANGIIWKAVFKADDVSKIAKVIQGADYNSLVVYISPAFFGDDREIARNYAERLQNTVFDAWDCKIEHKGRQGDKHKLETYFVEIDMKWGPGLDTLTHWLEDELGLHEASTI